MNVDDACAKALAYVDAHGDAASQQRARAILGEGSAQALLDAVSVDEEDVLALRRALGLADDLRAVSLGPVKGWCSALVRMQAEDGGWLPGTDLEARVFETGMIAGHLAKTPYVRPSVLDAAAQFLAEHWTVDRVQSGAWEAIAAYAHVFANTDHDDADAILQWCGRELGKGFVTHRFGAIQTARVFVYCDAHGIPGAELGTEELLIALHSEQGLDGGFTFAPDPASEPSVQATLDGLLALRRLSSRGA
ncbi:MAG: hypothetical protein AAF430_02860 [Myxococcota bacterium]